jgi:hypothetical protein
LKIAVAISYRKSFYTLSDLHHDCSYCKLDEGQKLEWGCESPSAEPQLFIPCGECPAEGGCMACGGSGFEPISRCPRAVWDRDVAEFFSLFKNWPQALPFAGGIYDQPAGYVLAMRVIEAASDSLLRAIQDEQKTEVKTSGNC